MFGSSNKADVETQSRELYILPDAKPKTLTFNSGEQLNVSVLGLADCCLHTGKGVLSEQEHFPSGASGQSSLEYKCAYLCLYIRKSSLDYDSIKIFIKISCIWPPHMEIVIKVVQCLGG